MKNILWNRKKIRSTIATLICIVMIGGLTACGTAATVPFDPTEYGALYDKYIASIDVGMIFNATWDDANNVDPNYYLYYYASSILRSGGEFEVAEDYGMYIPQEELEAFVQSHFEVTVEHLRSGEYYIAERNVYEFGGLGSTWYCDITGAEQKGKLLTIQYDVIGPMDYAIGKGFLSIEINGDKYKYLSNEMEYTAQSYLDYPNSTGIVDNKGILMMDSGSGRSGLGSGETLYWYSGQVLSDIIKFYETEALPKLEAQGEADLSKYEDGWYWSGTYRGGKPLIIDIQRKFGADTYIITALYEAKANPNVADNMRSRTFMQPPDLNDFSSLYAYLWKPYNAGVLDDSWSMPENVYVDRLIAYYALYMQEVEQLDGYANSIPIEDGASFPADDVESYIQQYFDVSTDTTRGWNVYDSDKNAYTYTPADVTAICNVVSATSYGKSDDGAMKIMIAYEVRRSEEDDTLIWSGELTVELSDTGYKYISNNQYYPQYPITQDAAYLEDISRKYVWTLAPSTGILRYSWITPQDIPANFLVDICSANNFLNLPRENGEYTDHYGPAAQVEAMIQQYFNVSAEYLRTSTRYNYYDEYSKEQYHDGYVMLDGGGWGGADALNAEQDGDLLKITIGIYGPDDEPDRPYMTGLLTIKLDGNNFQYLSYELA